MSSSSSSSRGKSRSEKDREKLVQDRLQVLLTHMLKDEDNKYCVDCDAKGPRWSSWNLGLFLCIRCAGIHRNLGVHISKVKSVNLDSWTPAQVASMQLMGNSRARAVYEANLPDHFKRPQNDQALEQFVRNKYEKKKFIAKEYIPSTPPDLPEGWYELIEAEKAKRDIRKIVLPSHTKGKTGSSQASPVKEEASTARPKAGAAASSSPAAATPPPKAPAAQPAPAAVKKTSPSDDLLGLGIGGGSSDADFLGLSSAPTSNAGSGFNAFVSAPSASVASPAATTTTSTAATGTASEEAAFFSQSSGAATEASKKSTKDSILALYGQMPAAPPPLQQQNQPQGGNMFAGMTNGSGLMQQQQPQARQPRQQQGIFGQMQGFGVPPQQQQQPQAASVQQQSNLNFGGNNPFLGSNNGGSNGVFGGMQQQSNPLGQVQNQFGGLNLGNGFPSTAAPNNGSAFGPMTSAPAAAAPATMLNPTKPANPAAASMDPLSLWQ